MKQKIDPKDIRKGDLIRAEYGGKGEATEYRSTGDGLPWNTASTHYLLERPEPPFEPHWGMVIGDPHIPSLRGAYLPQNHGDHLPWLTIDDGWAKDGWAKKKLAEGWVVIEKPGGVK